MSNTEKELKQDILALADLIASVAETEAELETPTELADRALEVAIEIVERVFGTDIDELENLRSAKRTIETSIEELLR